MTTFEKIVNAFKERVQYLRHKTLYLTHIVEVDCELDEDDGEYYPVVANAIYYNSDNILCVRDYRDDDENGWWENEWEVESLSENIQSEILWAFKNGHIRE